MVSGDQLCSRSSQGYAQSLPAVPCVLTRCCSHLSFYVCYFIFKQPFSSIWRAFAPLILSLNARERKGFSKRLSSFRKKKKKSCSIAVAAGVLELGEEAGRAAPWPRLCTLQGTRGAWLDAGSMPQRRATASNCCCRPWRGQGRSAGARGVNGEVTTPVVKVHEV